MPRGEPMPCMSHKKEEKTKQDSACGNCFGAFIAQRGKNALGYAD
jgi:hypothetical protein